MAERVRILFLAANPKNTDKVRLDEEIRQIQERIRAADFRDHFDLQSRWAVRPDDLLQALNEVRPHIVHFSGHGTASAELVLEDAEGKAKPVTDVALKALFTHLKGDIQLVVLNSCHSNDQANVISEQVDCTIGMNEAVGDEAAITFAQWLYGALAFGRSIAEAFEQAQTALLLHGITEENTPTLHSRSGVDPRSISFIKSHQAAAPLPKMSYEILQIAIAGNSPINYVRYDGGIAVTAGLLQIDSGFDMAARAEIEEAMGSLLRCHCIREDQKDLYYVTQTGYEVANSVSDGDLITFARIKQRMPQLIAEMKKDLTEEGGACVREFFVKGKNTMLGGSSKRRFAYFPEEHENLKGKMDVLENAGLIMDVTTGNVPIYRMSEEFVSLVVKFG